MKKPQVKTLQSALRLLIILFYFFYIFWIPFHRYSEKTEHSSCQKHFQNLLKASRILQKAKPLLRFAYRRVIDFLANEYGRDPRCDGRDACAWYPDETDRRSRASADADVFPRPPAGAPQRCPAVFQPAPLPSAPLLAAEPFNGAAICQITWWFCSVRTNAFLLRDHQTLFHLWLELDLNPGRPKERRNVLTPSAPAIFNVDGRISPSTCKYHTSAASNSVIQTICLCEHLCKIVIKAKGRKF